jgi:peptide-methionine (S)-S-oxide reductase
VEAVYRHTRGVTRAVSGYAGGTAKTAQYHIVSSGSTDHAESVEVTFDPSVITYDQILRIFFTVAHDPTELNRQGPDEGRQYRSAIFAVDKEQERIARAYVAQLNREKAYTNPVVTEVIPLTRFFAAEAYHQNYAALHPDEMYIRINDAPKIDRLREAFPDWFVADKTR